MSLSIRHEKHVTQNMSGNDYGFNAKSTFVIYIFAYYVVNRDVVAYICRRKNVLFGRKN